jgi:predicted DNA-binding protein
MRQKNFQIDDETHGRLKVLAAQEGKTLGETIKRLIDIHDEIVAADFQEKLDWVEIDQAIKVIEAARERHEDRHGGEV